MHADDSYDSISINMDSKVINFLCISSSLKLTCNFPSVVSCNHCRPGWRLESSEEDLHFDCL